MATTEELLAQLESEAQSDTPVCIIDPETRTITVPPEYQLFGVENDKRVERIPFRCPKIVGDNQDLSQDYQLFVNYQNANGDPDAYHIDDMEVDGDNITFSWLLEENVTKYRGDIQFAFGAIIPGDEAEDPDKNRWNTTINTDCTCLVGLKCTQQVAESNPDALVQIWAAIDELKAGGGGTGGTTNYNNLSNKPQLNGVTLEGNKTFDQVGVLAKNQGDSNSGKYLSVGSDGNVVPADAPSGGTVDPEQIKQAVNGYLEENPVSGMTAEQERQLEQNTTDVADLKSALEQIGDGGWSSTQIDLFEAFTNVIAYTSPDANSIVSSLISSLRSGSSDTPEGSFSIIYVLSNVTSSSKDNSIKSGEPYNTTLTANPGYELESVIVKMGGSDITSTAYSDGEITISAVTGNIVITASAVQSSASGQLPQDGLVDYFDFRNKSYTAGGSGLYYINSDYGNGMLYSWSNQSSKQGDDIGIKGAGGSYTSERATGHPVTDNFPSTRTVCLFGKGGPSVPTSIGVDAPLNNSFLYQIKYIATDKTTKSLMNEAIQYPEGFNKTGYNASFTVVSQNILKIYFDDTLHKTVDGSEIEDFESWDITPLALASFSNYGVAYAIYNKELSEVEIVEALEFFKTLEVSE